MYWEHSVSTVNIYRGEKTVDVGSYKKSAENKMIRVGVASKSFSDDDNL
jgi:hypothetical protein